MTTETNIDALRAEGKKCFEARLEFADRFMIYNSKCRDRQRRVHAIWDMHTHFTDYFSISPRLGFWSAQGGCGKSTATEISYFFVQSPMLERNSGAGLLRKIDETINGQGQARPTILFDEVQNAFGPAGNSAIADMLYSYTKGAKRTIWDDGKPITLDPFCPVVTNGLTIKYEIPTNYIERNIPINLERPLPEEQQRKNLWLFDLLRQEVEETDEDGSIISSNLRDPIAKWAEGISDETLRKDQDEVVAHLKARIDNGRWLQLCLPLAHTAYYVGEYYDPIIDDVLWLLSSQDTRYTSNEQLLIDLHQIISDKSNVEGNWFLPTARAVDRLNDMADRPWPTYKGKGMTGHYLSALLRDFGVKPEQNEAKAARGYNVAELIAPWKRALRLDMPEWMKQYY